MIVPTYLENVIIKMQSQNEGITNERIKKYVHCWQIFQSQLLKRKTNNSKDQIRHDEQCSNNCSAQQNDGPGPLVIRPKKAFNLEAKKIEQ